MVYSLSNRAWSKSHHGALGEEKVFPSALEEPDEPVPSHALGKPHPYCQFPPKSIWAESASAQIGITIPSPGY